MASDDLNIPQIAVVGVQDDNNSGPPDKSSFPLPHIDHANSPSVKHGKFALPTPILRNSRNSLDVPGTLPSHTPDASSSNPPPSPTLSAHSLGSTHWATSALGLRDNNPEEHDGLSSLGLLLAPPSQGHRRKGSTGTVSSIGSSSTDRDIAGSSSLGLSPVRYGHSDVPSKHPSPTPTNTHVDAGSDTSLPSLAADFIKRTVQRVRHPSPSPSGGTDIGSGTTQEADLNVEPFAFKPLQLADLVDPKRRLSLKTLESLGGLEALLRGLGTNRLRGLSTKLTPSQLGSHDPGTINAVTPYGVEMTSFKPNIMITSPASVPEGLQSTASLGGGSDVGRLTSLKFSAGAYEATIGDRQRIYGQNILPQRQSKSLLLLMWLALQDKVLVSPKIPHLFS